MFFVLAAALLCLCSTVLSQGKRSSTSTTEETTIATKATGANYGYEPYWADNEWVFSKHYRTTPADGSITCSTVHCPAVHANFGLVCGKNVDGKEKTFKNYCEMLNSDCTGRDNWLVAYRGKCGLEVKTIPTRAADLIDRAKQYLAYLSTTRATTNTLQGR